MMCAVKLGNVCFCDYNMTVHLRLVSSITLMLLGPWIGIQIFYLHTLANSSTWPHKENAILCAFFYLTNIIFINWMAGSPSNTGSGSTSRILLLIWLISSVIFLLGHWITYATFEATRIHPESISELKAPYIAITVCYIFLTYLPAIKYLLTTPKNQQPGGDRLEPIMKLNLITA